MIATLIYNTPELIESLKQQIKSIHIIDVSDSPLEGCSQRYETNLLWANNWDRFLKEYSKGYVWMLNSDVSGLSIEMYEDLKSMMDSNTFMVTPAFNSPHLIFNQNKLMDISEVSWIDMCCPLINVEIYHKLGGFDSQFKGYFADVDLCYRARQEGYKMYVNHNFNVNHLGSYTVNKTGKHEQAAIQDDILLVNKYGKSYYHLI